MMAALRSMAAPAQAADGGQIGARNAVAGRGELVAGRAGSAVVGEAPAPSISASGRKRSMSATDVFNDGIDSGDEAAAMSSHAVPPLKLARSFQGAAGVSWATAPPARSAVEERAIAIEQHGDAIGTEPSTVFDLQIAANSADDGQSTGRSRVSPSEFAYAGAAAAAGAQRGREKSVLKHSGGAQLAAVSQSSSNPAHPSAAAAAGAAAAAAGAAAAAAAIAHASSLVHPRHAQHHGVRFTQEVRFSHKPDVIIGGEGSENLADAREEETKASHLFPTGGSSSTAFQRSPPPAVLVHAPSISPRQGHESGRSVPAAGLGGVAAVLHTSGASPRPALKAVRHQHQHPSVSGSGAADWGGADVHDGADSSAHDEEVEANSAAESVVAFVAAVTEAHSRSASSGRFKVRSDAARAADRMQLVTATNEEEEDTDVNALMSRRIARAMSPSRHTMLTVRRRRVVVETDVLPASGPIAGAAEGQLTLRSASSVDATSSTGAIAPSSEAASDAERYTAGGSDADDEGFFLDEDDGGSADGAHSMFSRGSSSRVSPMPMEGGPARGVRGHRGDHVLPKSRSVSPMSASRRRRPGATLVLKSAVSSNAAARMHTARGSGTQPASPPASPGHPILKRSGSAGSLTREQNPPADSRLAAGKIVDGAPEGMLGSIETAGSSSSALAIPHRRGASAMTARKRSSSRASRRSHASETDLDPGTLTDAVMRMRDAGGGVAGIDYRDGLSRAGSFHWSDVGAMEEDSEADYAAPSSMVAARSNGSTLGTSHTGRSKRVRPNTHQHQQQERQHYSDAGTDSGWFYSDITSLPPAVSDDAVSEASAVASSAARRFAATLVPRPRPMATAAAPMPLLRGDTGASAAANVTGSPAPPSAPAHSYRKTPAPPRTRARTMTRRAAAAAAASAASELPNRPFIDGSWHVSSLPTAAAPASSKPFPEPFMLVEDVPGVVPLLPMVSAAIAAAGIADRDRSTVRGAERQGESDHKGGVAFAAVDGLEKHAEGSARARGGATSAAAAAGGASSSTWRSAHGGTRATRRRG